MARPNCVEEFSLVLRELAFTARQIKELHLPNVPAHIPLKVAIEVIQSLSVLEPLFQKSLDLLWQDEEQMTLDQA